MDTATLKTSTIDDWLAFAEANPGSRTELVDGEIVHMSPETVRHARVTFLVAYELESAIRDVGATCDVSVDGVGVRITDRNGFVPDVLVECSLRSADDAWLSAAPMILVEVLSPSNSRQEMTRKLLGYSRRESVEHYLVVDPASMTVDHHRRDESGMPVLVPAGDDLLELSPPGIRLDPRRFFDR